MFRRNMAIICNHTHFNLKSTDVADFLFISFHNVIRTNEQNRIINNIIILRFIRIKSSYIANF
jgi:hypothetical protein